MMKNKTNYRITGHTRKNRNLINSWDKLFESVIEEAGYDNGKTINLDADVVNKKLSNIFDDVKPSLSDNLCK
jgi:ATP-dependent protease HslVU (ClpYQ) ATPase subunit